MYPSADLMLLIGTLIGGLIILGVSADLLIRGATVISRKFGLSALFAGVVIIGFGTSVPELFVTLGSSLNDAPGLALGNIIGSNIANILLVLAVPALLFTVSSSALGLKRAMAVLLLATFAWIIVTALLPLSPWIGAIFLAGLIGYVMLMLYSYKSAEQQGQDLSFEDSANGPLALAGFFIVIGLIGLPLGAQTIVDSGVGVASALNVSETIIGLSVLAIGTSLPELAASIAAAFRSRSDLIMGNIIGSNMFNLFGAGAAAAFFGPFDVAQSFHNYDHWVLGFVTLILALFIFPKSKVTRIAGGVLILLYLVYLFGLMNDWNILGFARQTIG